MDNLLSTLVGGFLPANLVCPVRVRACLLQHRPCGCAQDDTPTGIASRPPHLPEPSPPGSCVVEGAIEANFKHPSSHERAEKMVRCARLALAAVVLLAGHGKHCACAWSSGSDVSAGVAPVSVSLVDVTTNDVFSSVNAGITVAVHGNLTESTTPLALSVVVDVVSQDGKTIGCVAPFTQHDAMQHGSYAPALVAGACAFCDALPCRFCSVHESSLLAQVNPCVTWQRRMRDNARVGDRDVTVTHGSVSCTSALISTRSHFPAATSARSLKSATSTADHRGVHY